MIAVIPGAAVPTTTVWTEIVRQLRTDRKAPESLVSTANRAVISNSPTNGPKIVQIHPTVLRGARDPALRAETASSRSLAATVPSLAARRQFRRDAS